VGFETIRKNTAPEMVVDQILKKIASGELGAGTRLPAQRELAARLGVGRSSVREALNALAVMGYLDVQQGRGTFIAAEPPGDEPPVAKLRAALRAGSLLDLMEVREALECRAAALAAGRREAGHLRRLKQVLKEMEADPADYGRFLEADVEFHTILAQATGNPVFNEMLRLVLKKVVDHHEALSTGRLSPGYRDHSRRTLKEALACIEKNDGPGAARAMESHLGAIRSELKDIL
jgi:GntR family transcriptional repressor for pyruvate dehydrogenase complex